MLAVFKHLRAVNKNVSDADGVLTWIFEGGFVGDCIWIEDNDIGEITGSEKASAVEAEICRGQVR